MGADPVGDLAEARAVDDGGGGQRLHALAAAAAARPGARPGARRRPAAAATAAHRPPPIDQRGARRARDGADRCRAAGSADGPVSETPAASSPSSPCPSRCSLVTVALSTPVTRAAAATSPLAEIGVPNVRLSGLKKPGWPLAVVPVPNTSSSGRLDVRPLIARQDADLHRDVERHVLGGTDPQVVPEAADAPEVPGHRARPGTGPGVSVPAGSSATWASYQLPVQRSWAAVRCRLVSSAAMAA